MDTLRFLMMFGLVLMVVGLLWPWLSPLGLGWPLGDIVIEGVNTRILMPIIISLLVSILISPVPWLLNR